MTTVTFGGAASSSSAKIRTVQSVSPISTQVVAMTAGDSNGSLVLTPANMLASLTVTLPPESGSILGQERRIITTQAITSLSVSGATTIINAPAALAANTTVTFEKIAANTWVRQ